MVLGQQVVEQSVQEISARRLLLIVGVAVAAHVLVRIVRLAIRLFLSSKLGSISKSQTVTSFLGSVIVFMVWFVAVGYVLSELGVPIQTYIASATVIGLAVSFGSQALVQDVISGLTLIFTGLIDIGDMVDIAGQTGLVESIGIRYTQLRNVQGALIYIPNRNVANVVRFPSGYIRAFVDVRLPPAGAEGPRAEAEALVRRTTESIRGQFAGIMVKPPSVMLMNDAIEAENSTGIPAKEPPAGGAPSFLRLKFRIWPGQGGVIEGAVKQRILQSMQAIDSGYQEWMVVVHYRVEPTFTRRAQSALEMLRSLGRRRSRTPPAPFPPHAP